MKHAGRGRLALSFRGSFTFCAALAALAVAAVPARAQVCGDVTGDGLVKTTDALAVLKTAVGQDVNLVCSGECAALETRVAALETLLAHVSVVGNNLVLTGMNFQVVSGSGSTDGTINGKGNIIIGYDEADNKDKKTGSHNLVIGDLHNYPTFGSIVAGYDNSIEGEVASVLGGSGNRAIAGGSVIVGGTDNRTYGITSTVAGGEVNRTDGRSAAVAGGTGNEAAGNLSVVSGGSGNAATGGASVLSGGLNRSVSSPFNWQGGGLFQTQ